MNKQGLEELGKTPGVIRIEENGIVKIPEPITNSPSLTPTPTTPGSIEWNIQKIGADKVWNELGITGQGVTVADLDTGVNWEHPALKNAYRGWNGNSADHTYNWYDAFGGEKTPYDDNNHGTHTTGIMIGKEGTINQIGVAPGAKWMAAKFLSSEGSGSFDDALEAMQWLLAPKKPDGTGEDPTKAPDIVSNSWGTTGCTLSLQSAVQAWRDAGIIPVFSNGNSGPEGRTVKSPADFPESIGVGATDINDIIADFSSRGPTCSALGNGIKPEVSAPGVSVRSSVGTDGYDVYSGTSMAAPHVSGLAALLISSNPTLTVDEIEEAIEKTALDLGNPGQDNNYGFGRIDAYKALSQYASIIGTLTGTVTVGGNPIDDVSLKITRPNYSSPITIKTSQNGTYTTKLSQGNYSVTFSKFGYKEITKNAIVTKDQTTILDSALEALPKFTINGKVTKEDTSPLPVPATVQVLATPLPPAFTDPSGNYTISDVPEGIYDFVATASSYIPQTKKVTINGNTQLNFALKTYPTLPVKTDFEDGLGDWTTSGLWHVESQGKPCSNPHGGTSSAYYGQYTCNYATGNSRNYGALTSPLFFIPENTNDTELSFWSLFETEDSSYYDKRLIQLRTDTDTAWTTIYQDIYDQAKNPFNTWNSKAISLNNYKGKAIQLRFFFDTIDSDANFYKGWYVDDVLVSIKAADLEVNQKAPETITKGETLTFQVEYQNSGLLPAENVELVDIFEIPEGASIKAVTNNGQKVSYSASSTPTPPTGQKGGFKIPLGTLSSGQKGFVEVKFDVSQNTKMNDTYTNTVSLTTTSQEYDFSNNTSTNTTRVITAELVSSIVQPKSAPANTRFTSNTKVENKGEVRADNVVVTVDISGNVKFRIVSASLTGGPSPSPLPTAFTEGLEKNKTKLRFEVGSLNLNESKQVKVVLRTQKDKAGQITVKAKATTTTSETNPENEVQKTTRITK